jgi:hypothetical protein
LSQIDNHQERNADADRQAVFFHVGKKEPDRPSRWNALRGHAVKNTWSDEDSQQGKIVINERTNSIFEHFGPTFRNSRGVIFRIFSYEVICFGQIIAHIKMLCGTSNRSRICF